VRSGKATRQAGAHKHGGEDHSDVDTWLWRCTVVRRVKGVEGFRVVDEHESAEVKPSKKRPDEVAVRIDTSSDA